MKIGRVVGFLAPAGVELGAVVVLNGKESLVAKVAGSGKLVWLVKGEAYKADSCSYGSEVAGLVRTATGVSLNQNALDLTNETVYLPNGEVFKSFLKETAVDDEETVSVPVKSLRSLSAFVRAFGSPAVALATKQIRHKKAFNALPLEYKAQLKNFI